MKQSKIYLIKLPHYYHIYDWNLPVGLLYLGSYLKSRGVDLELIDLSGSEDDNWSIPLDGDYYCISSNTPDFYLAVKISNYLKQKTAGKIVIGGIHATSFPSDILKNDSFDIAVIGEGEHTLIEIVSGMPLDKINGISYRKNSEIIVAPKRELEKKLDTFPRPDLGLIDLEKYINPIIIKDQSTKGIPMLVSRGCPYECIFCASPTMWHRVTRFHSLDYIKKNLDYYLSLGIKNIFFCDDTITVNRKILKQLCLELKERNITWRCNSTTNVITPELTDMLFEHGCRQVDFGIESGSNRVLKTIKKCSTAEQHRKAVFTARESGLMTKCMLMVGHPHETEADVMETINFIKNTPSDLYALSVFVPLPGCAVAKSPQDFNFEVDKSMGFDEYFIMGKMKDTPIVHKKKEQIEKYRDMIYEAIGRQSTLDVIKKRDSVCCP